MPLSPLAPVVSVLSVIVVAADSGSDLRDCLRSVLAWSMPLELLLVDNNSSDGVPQAVDRAWENDPRVRVLYNHANLGFGAAVNRGASQAHSDTLLVLNPDCIVDEASAQHLLGVLAGDAGAGLVGAVVCDEHGVPDPASLRRDPLLRRALNTLFGGERDGVNVAGPPPDHVVEAEAVSGALMLLPRQVFERIGGFDTGYFLHCEDLDLCRRIRDDGLRVLLAGHVRVLHAKGGSSAHRPLFVSKHKHRGMWRWFRKFDPAARNPVLAGLVWLGIWAHFLVQVPGQLWRRHAYRRARAMHADEGRGD